MARDDELHWLREIAEAMTGIGEPSIYDVFADIVIPAFVGIGTLALAVASVYISIQSHRAARDAVTEARRANDIAENQYSEQRSHGELGERRRIGAEIVEWFNAAASAAFKSEGWAATTQENYTTVNGSIERRDDAALRKYMRQLRVEILKIEKETVELLNRKQAGLEFARALQRNRDEVRRWVDEPDYFRDLQEAAAKAADERARRDATD